MDALLRHVMIAAGFLADEDALGIATGALEHRIRDQAVVEHDVGLLQQLQCAQREQIRIAGARADQIHLARLALRPFELARERLADIRFIARQHPRADDAADDAFPERPALAREQSSPARPCADRRRSGRARRAAPAASASICSRTRRASTGDCPPEPTATMTGERSMIAGKMNVDSSRIIHDVDRHAPRARAASDTAAVHLAQSGGAR